MWKKGRVRVDEFTAKNDREHILSEPGMYVGSTDTTKCGVWLMDPDEKRIIYKMIKYNPGLIHIFREILSNAHDNVERSFERSDDNPVTVIRVTLDLDTGRITVWNDGLWIPVEETDELVRLTGETVYVPTMIFGRTKTSGNYDQETNTGGGQYGFGAKLTNVFSSEFTVVCHDPYVHKTFTQTWTDNMETENDPIIKRSSAKRGYTQISWIPDWSRFGDGGIGYSKYMIQVFHKLCADVAMASGVPVTFKCGDYSHRIVLKLGDDKSPRLVQYVRKFYKFKCIDLPSPNLSSEVPYSQCVVAEWDQPGQSPGSMAWCNGIFNPYGGVHVNGWVNPIVTLLKDDIFGGGKKGAKIYKPSDFTENLVFFVAARVNNPKFEDQRKTRMIKPVANGALGGLRGERKDTAFAVVRKKLLAMKKWDFVIRLQETADDRANRLLAKGEGKGTKRRPKVAKLKDANWASHRDWSKRVRTRLLVTEGDSALASAISAMSVVKNGHSIYGGLPIRGKILNPDGKSAAVVAANAEIDALKRTLGIRQNADYSKDSEFQTLRYGGVWLLCDADDDGYHIQGLIMWLFKSLWPSLWDREYIQAVATPVVKISKGKGKSAKQLEFYINDDYIQWCENNSQRGWNKPKYYKGLGSSTPLEAKRWLKYLRRIDYVNDKHAKELLDMAFNSKRTNDRKEWLGQLDPSSITRNYREEEIENGVAIRVPVSKFVKNDLVLFSWADCVRSLPGFDGLKPGQRKVLYALRKNGVRTPTKMIELIGKVMSDAQYHHGDAALAGNMTGLAQSYPGSNNIPLLVADGQFGSRLKGGKDAASARYISTALDPMQFLIFRPEDDPILNYLESDGISVEPKTYYPIVPMVLINGSDGIGTGWSTQISSIHPMRVVKWIKLRMNGKNPSKTMKLKPWWNGWNGTVKREGKSWVTRGEMVNEGNGVYRITELPIGMWTQLFKESVKAKQKKPAKSGLTYWEEEGIISGYTEGGDENTVDFEIIAGDNWDEEMVRNSLITTLQADNMHAFDVNGTIKRYNDYHEILEYFCEQRLDAYKRRRRWWLKEYKHQLTILSDKYRFVREIINDTLSIKKRPEQDVMEELRTKGYRELLPDEKGYDVNGFRYLTNLPMRSMTSEMLSKLKRERDNLQQTYDDLKNATPTDIWLKELDEFVSAFQSRYTTISEE